MEVKPFKAFRFDSGVAGDVGSCIAPPYDCLSPAQQEQLYKKNEYNIVRIIKGKTTPSDNPDNNQYTRAADYLNTWLKKGVLKQDLAEAIYAYVQDFQRAGAQFQRFSFIALAKLEEFGKTVRPHEQTLVTPNIPHIMALNYQCKKLLSEGMENVWQRHSQMAEFVRAWAKENFALFCEEKYASNTLTAIRNTRGINVAETINALQEKHNTIFGNGCGKLKEESFRIAHMGDITLDELKELLGWLNEEIS